MRDVLVLLGFRPHLFKELVKALTLINGLRVHIFQDGPRQNRLMTDKELITGNQELIKSLREEGIEIRYHQAVTNNGVKRLDIGIDWFFNEVELGAVLEEDCIPTSASFDFLFDMLARYRKDSNIAGISAYSCLGNVKSRKDKFGPGQVDHYAASLSYTWGWATWRDRWQTLSMVDISPNSFSQGDFRALGTCSVEGKIMDRVLLSIAVNHYDYWDYKFLMRIIKKKMFFIHPEHSLIRNIGFGNDSSHKHSQWIKRKINVFAGDYVLSQNMAIDPKRANALIFYTAYCEIPPEISPLYLKRIYWIAKYRVISPLRKLLELMKKGIAGSCAHNP